MKLRCFFRAAWILPLLASAPAHAAGKPAEEPKQLAGEQAGWFPFDPGPDKYSETAVDLRFLNERFAGEGGYIVAKDGHFVHGANGKPVRFWAVNGPPHDLRGPGLKDCARMLAKRGINLVRIHGGYFDKQGEVDPAKVQHTLESVAAMKTEGIYSHLSIYFPLWFLPAPDNPYLQGYDGKKHPFAALFFNGDFQAQYRKWWQALLQTPGPSGKSLVDDPAVAALEIQNEDSFFFWTFSEQNLPDPQLRALEKMFGDWLAKRYGSLERALSAWQSATLKRDVPQEGRVAFRPLWTMFNEKTARDRDTARFLFELQRKFYADTYAYLRKLGFKGVITASNWSTASPEVFGPLEKLTYTTTDFLDRHGYFSCFHKGQNAEWSIQPGHTYADRSALRFDPEEPGKPRQFVHPAMDPKYDNKPSMISETTWNRPNRFRGEAPLYYAVYGALQDSDGIVHFALDGTTWSVKPNFHMQPWTLMSPAMMGQFPAAALIYRLGLVAAGPVLAEVNLNRDDLLALKGTPLPQDAALDELRLKDVPAGAEVKPGQRLDPLLHYAGRAQVTFSDSPSRAMVRQTRGLIDHQSQTVRSATGELQMDYGKGVLVINAPLAQGASGMLRQAGRVETRDLIIESAMEPGHLVLVALDGKPLGHSRKMLLQVMSEEKPSGFATEPLPGGVLRISSVGQDPWLAKVLDGNIQLKRPDAASLTATALNFNLEPVGKPTPAGTIPLLPSTIYFLIQ